MPLARRSPCLRLLFLPLAVGGSLGLPALPAQAGVLHNPQGYTLTIPQGWQTRHEMLPHAGGFSTDAIYAHPAHAFPVFRVEVDPQRAATMANAEAMQAAFVREHMPGFQVAQQRLRRVAGSPAAETASGGYYRGLPVLLDTIFTIHNGRNYTFTLITTPRTVIPDLKTFERVLKTLHWEKTG